MTTTTLDPREFLRSLEQQVSQPVFQSRPRLTRDQLQAMIRAERLKARQLGQEWTCWRKFYCAEEAVSPNRCMFWGPYFREPCCTIIATYVSYHTQRAERLCICSGHFEEELRLYNESQGATRKDQT